MQSRQQATPQWTRTNSTQQASWESISKYVLLHSLDPRKRTSPVGRSRLCGCTVSGMSIAWLLIILTGRENRPKQDRSQDRLCCSTQTRQLRAAQRVYRWATQRAYERRRLSGTSIPASFLSCHLISPTCNKLLQHSEGDHARWNWTIYCYLRVCCVQQLELLFVRARSFHAVKCWLVIWAKTRWREW